MSLFSFLVFLVERNADTTLITKRLLFSEIHAIVGASEEASLGS